MPTRDKKSRKSDVDVDVVKAIGHPLRMQLLGRLNERVASPVELARELGESVQLVSYHVRILRDLGFVELVSTTPRRGAIEHHYRAIRRALFSDEDFAAIPANARSNISGGIIEEMFKDVAEALDAGMFEGDTKTNLTRDRHTLDDEAWEKLAAKVAEVWEYANELEAEALVRIQNGAEGFTGFLNVLLYPAAPPAAAKAGKSASAKKKKS